MMNATKTFDMERTKTMIWFVLLIVAPIVLWMLPADFFDAEGGIIICPSRALFNIECLGCGMTRAIMHFHHFELDDAIYFNRGSFLVYPALVAIWGMWVIKAKRKLF